MPKEWTGPSEYFAAGLYGNQNRKAIFQSVLAQERHHSRSFNAMDFEEGAADLSLKKTTKRSNYECSEKRSYPTSYSLDETMDLSTKWRAPPTTTTTTSERKPLPLPPLGNTTQHDHHHHKRNKSSHHHHSRMLPRKRLHTDHNHHHRQQNSGSTSPDIIVLSDEGRVNGHVNGGYESEGGEMPPLPVERQWEPEELLRKRRLFNELRDGLRSEEMKLVLLKKLHQSQMVKDNLINQAAAVVAGKVVPAVVQQGGRGTVAPPPLVRSGQVPPPASQQGKHPVINSPLQLCNQNAHGGPPPLIGQRGNTTTSSIVSSNLLMRSCHNSSRAPVNTPPNMVMNYNLHTMQQQSAQSNQQSTPQACPSPSSQLDSSQTPAQRQAAAKLALRKQLEKTLLQIPPPKPPPPEMHFVPNANNPEFICLLGLERVVDLITEDPCLHRPPPDPFECVQCATDFSPVWKWQSSRTTTLVKPAVICETCVTSNIKKALKAEHTNRLKTAFVKALQQEQEIEQRMTLPSPPPTVGVSPTHTPSPTPPTSHSPVGLKLPSNSLMKLSAAHQSLLHAQQLQQHFAALQQQQPQPAHMYPFAPLLAAQAYSYQQLMGGGKNPLASSAELQRQYLLDMIPPRSQGSINWKT